MVNKCAKFHTDSPSDKKVKFNLAESDWACADGRFCVQLCIETLCKRATSVAHLTNFSFEFFMKFSQKMRPLLFLYHGAKRSKMTKTQIKGSCLNLERPAKAYLIHKQSSSPVGTCFPGRCKTSSSMLVFKKNVLSLLDSPACGKNLLQICFGNTTI